MKKITFMLFLLLPVLYCVAQSNSNLTISTTGNSNLKIKFNGKQYSLQDRSATFQNMQPGNYALVIYQPRLTDKGIIEYAEVFNNSITLKQQKHLEISVLRFGKTAWDESDITADDWNNDYNTNPIGLNGYNKGESEPVSVTAFEKIKKAINEQYYDDKKLVYATVIVKDNWFSADQITELCKLFAYDDSKLSIAKYAYNHCTDKGNYYTITNAFYYNDTKEQLMKFIGSK